MRQLIILVGFVIILAQYAKGDGMIEVFRWKQIDYQNGGTAGKGKQPQGDGGRVVFPNEGLFRRRSREVSKITSRDDVPQNLLRSNAQPMNQNGSYIAYNNVPMGVTHHKGRLFITVPRRRVGIPSTLNFIDLKKVGAQESPKLRAYPDLTTNQFDQSQGNPNSLISVYRTTVDECNRLWFIDTGTLEYPGNRIQVQRPSIWMMDLKTDRVLHRFEIPESVAPTGHGLASLTIDVLPSECGRAFAYIPDLVNNRLNVYSLEDDAIWSFRHNYFNFDPLAGDLNIGGQSFRWDDGIFSITLGPYKKNGARDVFFHPMATNNEFVVSNRVLQQEANADRSDHGTDFRLVGSRGTDRQSTMHVYDERTGVVFFAEIQQNGIGCWNTKRSLNADAMGTVFQDEEQMIYPSDLTIDQDGVMWVMSNSMPIFIYSELDTNIYNFRVWKQHVNDAVLGTKCASRI